MSACIIIVGYRSERWLRANFETVLSDMPVGWRAIYVDNASPDSGRMVVQDYEGVQVIQMARNVGFGRACNVGARAAIAAGSDVLIFLNPDVVARPEVLQELTRTLQEDSAVGIVGPLQYSYGGSVPEFNDWSRRIVIGPAIYPPDEFEVAPLDLPRFERWRTAHREELVDVSYVNGGAFAVAGETYERVGGFEPLYFLYFDEVELCRRVRALGLRTVVRPDLAVAHAWGGLSEWRLIYHWYRSRTLYLLLEPSLSLQGAVLEVFRRLPRDLRRPLWGSRAAVVLGVAAGSVHWSAVPRARNRARARA